ncbi:Hypothetical_protein [Hexamita inflata]|uniref:Hypothetical_protein n=1 Tax=Hexamita inflata TaxID=28002 RepID=A0AA86UU11_9EUKA|nr:Hypothetical protein HINF_LOCUS59385 [Hexamita inflata]
MPFIILSNNFSLQLVWSDSNTDELDIQDLNQQYQSIDINGVNNEFIDLQILNKTEVLRIKNCTIDLQQIKGRYQNVTLTNCKCIHDFTECFIIDFNIIDSQLQTSQLKNVEINSMDVTITNLAEFDYNNCHTLQCKLNILSISRLIIDLFTICGEWTSIQFIDCMFIGEVDNTRLKVSNVQLNITEQNYINNLSCLQSLKCNKFDLSVIGLVTYQKIDIIMPNENMNKQQMRANLNRCICNLNSIQGQWTDISFSNCVLEGNSKECKKKFVNTTIRVIVDQTCHQVNFNAFYGLKCNLTIQLNNIEVDLCSIRQCNPQQLQMTFCTFTIDEMVGCWKVLYMHQCNILQRSGTILSRSIRADRITMQDCDNEICQYFDTKYLEVFRSNLISEFPKTSKLCIINSSVKVTQQNKNIKYLSLLNVKLIKFSILCFPKLIGIDLNYFTEKNTKIAIIEFIRFKKKSVNALKQRLHRILYEQNQIQIKRIRIQKENDHLNSILCKQLIQLCGQSE